ncbi:JNK1/MAPK8-associated membrane protein [Anthonomus grandis grandis]|uniref:JNK1/MAPK8-associated membrane protein n=1 Tax=Anthonomus grandis grandis TaxID=2921223 RepID=UPI0021652470|nr:JNK1/MAPK8-associated membrane protein [Anthonomus grandis grandis]
MSCPGWYCGRILQDNGELSDCGSCSRGFRRNDTTFICEPCLGSPSLYDWLYLGFMVLMVLILHWFFIDMVSMRRSFSKNVLCLHITAFFEVLISSILALLATNPVGELTINSCGTRYLADWYTLLHNPQPNYEDKVYCTQEAVYPLYTIIFLFYTLSLLLMLLIRPWVCRKCLPRQGKMSIYAAMYFIPILILIHAVVGGLIYYSFPYLIVVISVISCAAHFAVRIEQTVSALIKSTVTQPRNVVIVLGHWGLHAYGIISLTQMQDPLMNGLLLLLVPLPAVFYIFTARFTDPTMFYL